MERVYRDLGHILKLFPKPLICDAKTGFVVCLFLLGFFLFICLGFFTNQLLAE